MDKPQGPYKSYDNTAEATLEFLKFLGRIVLWGVAILLVLYIGLLILIRIADRGHMLGRRAMCSSQLKQLGLAIQMYADRYQDRAPVDSTSPTLVGSMQLLSNVCPTAEILFCPSDRRRGSRAEKDFRKLTKLNISYSYVPNVMWQNEAADSPVLLDRIYATDALSPWPSDGNHKDTGGNILFNDGHVEFRQRLPSTLKEKNGKVVVLSP